MQKMAMERPDSEASMSFSGAGMKGFLAGVTGNLRPRLSGECMHSTALQPAWLAGNLRHKNNLFSSILEEEYAAVDCSKLEPCELNPPRVGVTRPNGSCLTRHTMT